MQTLLKFEIVILLLFFLQGYKKYLLWALMSKD